MLLNMTESDTKHSGTWIRNHVSKLSSAQQNLMMRSLTAMTSIDNYNCMSAMKATIHCSSNNQGAWLTTEWLEISAGNVECGFEDTPRRLPFRALEKGILFSWTWRSID